MPVQNDAALETVCVCVFVCTYVCMFWKIPQGNKNTQILTELWVMESEENLYFFSILFYSLKEVSGKTFKHRINNLKDWSTTLETSLHTSQDHTDFRLLLLTHISRSNPIETTFMLIRLFHLRLFCPCDCHTSKCHLVFPSNLFFLSDFILWWTIPLNNLSH